LSRSRGGTSSAAGKPGDNACVSHPPSSKCLFPLDASPDHAATPLDQVEPELVRAQPSAAQRNSFRLGATARDRQGMQRHGRHAVLVHRVDRIALGDAAGERIVVPPPLAQRPLRCDETLGTALRKLARFTIGQRDRSES
jgi:hypothetical protein